MNLDMSPQILDPVLLQTDYPELELHASGKVRDVYCLDSDHLLFVATDRISAFDYVLATGIPHKGRCVARGYLSGSGWKEYKATGTVCGIKLPPGLRESDQLPEPIFTPATKATTGHDINISFEEMCKLVDPELSRQLRDITLRIYKKAADYARQRGILIADTKFEFGQTAADTYQPGKAQDSYDKQYVRDYLEEIRWNKQPPAPALPQEVALRTSEKYLGAYRQLTGRELEI